MDPASPRHRINRRPPLKTRHPARAILHSGLSTYPVTQAEFAGLGGKLAYDARALDQVAPTFVLGQNRRMHAALTSAGPRPMSTSPSP
jgi:hypothetical protein